MSTVAEWLDNIYINKFYRILRLGLFRRMLEEEIKSGNTKLKDMHDEVFNKMEEIAETLEKGLRYSVISLKKLVTIQLAAGIYTLLSLR